MSSFSFLNTKTLAITNIIVLVATIIVNFLANRLPIGGFTTGELSDLYPNLFVPSGFTFSIWGVIYILLIGFVLWQCIDAWKKKPLGITTAIGPWFIMSCLANMLWIVAWHYRHVGIALIIMIGLLITLIMLGQKVRTGTKRGDWKNKLFTQVPFGVYLGWISVATIANVSTFLVDIQWNMWGMTDVFWTIVVLVVATLLGILQLIKQSNIPFVLVLLRAFYGIASKRIAIDPVYASNILWTLALCSIVLSGFLGWKWEQWKLN